MWELKDKYEGCCHNNDCDSFDTCIDCWDDWVERNPPMTNADRIRAMSDEELTDVFGWKNICDCILQQSAEHCSGFSSCKECMLEWLKQPAEGE